MSIDLYGCGVLQSDRTILNSALSVARAFGYDGAQDCSSWFITVPHYSDEAEFTVSRGDALAFGRALHQALAARSFGATMTEEQEAAWEGVRFNVWHLRELADFAISGPFFVD